MSAERRREGLPRREGCLSPGCSCPYAEASPWSARVRGGLSRPAHRAPLSMTSFQTVHLKRGRHLSPDHGVCVMELASMLSGERFTDRPRSVSPVIAAFL